MSGEIVLLAPNDSLLESYREVAPEGAEITWVDAGLSQEELAVELKDAVAIIANSAFTLDTARLCPKLKLVQVTSAGTDRFDLLALGEMGIRVANNGGGNAPTVAEHTISLMIGVYRKMHLQYQAVRSGEWGGSIRADWYHQAHELTGKTVGIVGLGHIGKQVAQRLQGWDCTLVYYDPFDIPKDVETKLNVTRLDLDEVLRTSDIVTLHVPLMGSTRGMISDRELGLMKPTAVLINACRGPVVDEAALIRALNAQEISAAGLDVLEEEPTPKDNPLLKMDNVVITAHMASFAQESGERSRLFAMGNVARVARGEEPTSIVLPE
jgi:phosphoglycerate dehydrogenase-like enzyme